MANQLIALDKNPGVCSIGIGKMLRRILGKATASVTNVDGWGGSALLWAESKHWKCYS